MGRTDLRELTQDSLGSQVAVVSQDVYLFNTTIRDNIRLRRPTATDDDVEEAAKLVVAHRLSTIRGADRVVMLDGGKVVASGPHDWLLTQSKPYQELLATQALDDHEAGRVT